MELFPLLRNDRENNIFNKQFKLFKKKEKDLSKS